MKWPGTFLVVAAILGCGKPEPARAPEPPPPVTVLVGLIPERNIFKQFERYEPLAAYLSARTGVHVKLKVLAHYGNVLDNFESLNLDGAFFGSFGYSLAHARLGVEVLARPELSDGTSTYRGVIFVRKDSGIRTVAQMKGKRLALVARATFAGYLFPLVHFHDAGVTDSETHFKEVYFAGSHDGAVRDVFNGNADVGATKNTVLRELAAVDPRIGKELMILAQSLDVPENGLALKKTIAPSVKKKLLLALTTMHEDPEGAKVLKQFGASRFIVTTDDDYRPLFTYGEKTGLNLGTCCFKSQR